MSIDLDRPEESHSQPAAEQRETWSGPGPSRLLIVDHHPAAEPDEIADTLGLSAAALQSSLWTMLRKLETSR